MPSIIASFFEQFRREHVSRLILWVPVLFAAGIAFYFTLPREPHWSVLATPAGLMVPCAYFWRTRRVVGMVLLAVLIALFGACWAKFITDKRDTTMLSYSLSPRMVEGNVLELEFLPTGVRLTLGDVRIAGLKQATAPKKVRLSLRAKQVQDLSVGMRVQLRAGLLPPSGPIVEGSFDFGRYFYFRGIGAVGYGLNPITVLKPAPKNTGFFGFWNEARHRLGERIQNHLPLPESAIATGLITGDDAAIPKDAQAALRAANLLHIIAISGTHMILIAGVVFASMRLLLLLLPNFGLKLQAKQVAAAFTLLAITAYLCITGFEISAIRAYVMMALILLSVLLLRDVNPMRSLAITAMIMLLLDPSDLMEPGFQLSFAATMAMIAVIEPSLNLTPEEALKRLRHVPFKAALFFLFLSISAELATAPLVMAMFHQFSPYGILSNFIAGPLVTFLIMPMVAFYFVLLPFGLDLYALDIMAYGIRALMWLSHEVASWPGALQYISPLTAWGVALYALGGCWLCIWQQRWRYVGIVAMVVGVSTLAFYHVPTVVVSNDMRHVMVQTPTGPALGFGRNYAMNATMIANALGMEILPYAKTQPDIWKCEGRICRYDHAEFPMLFDFTWNNDATLCAEATRMQAAYFFTDGRRMRCTGAFRLVTPRDRQRYGAYSLYVEDGKIIEKTTRDWQGFRPWSVGYRP